jgi:mRNA-degrading endonuclease HigB of HigAB toxin-antitoxin module
MKNENEELHQDGWWPELVKLNNLRVKKNQVPVSVTYTISKTNMLEVILGDKWIWNLNGNTYRTPLYIEYQLSELELGYIDLIIQTKVLDLISQNIKSLSLIPDSTITDFKLLRKTANMIISEIILNWETNHKESFNCLYNRCENHILMNHVTTADFIFMDWFELEPYVRTYITDFGYIIIDNQLKEL